MSLHIDFETYSACELRDEGLDNYANHPTTGVHCMAWCIDDKDVKMWKPHYHNDKDPTAIMLAHVCDGGLVYAHNAAFELAIWNNICVPKYGWPELKPEQVRCTMAMCYAMGLPGALEKAAPALGIEQAKDMVGQRIMLQLAKPRTIIPKWDGSLKPGAICVPEDTPIFYSASDEDEDVQAKFVKLYEYCKQDVVVERELTKRLMPLSDAEQAVWLLDQRINNRGIQVDLPSIEAAIKLVEAEKARLNGEMFKVTGGVVGAATEVQVLGKWIKSRGVEIAGLTKADVLGALGAAESDAGGNNILPPEVRRALQIRQEAAKSSTAKLVAMKNRASSDGRVRGGHQYHGAATGRWAHRGIQTGNYPRPRKGMKQKHIEDVITHLKDRDYIDMMYGPVMSAVPDTLRGMITAAPGNELVSPDYSNIEGRVIAWLAGEEWKLQAFRDFDAGIGPDLYLVSAGRIYNKPPSAYDEDSPERQEGKSAELALGFGGGVGAFQNMAKIYGVKVTDSRADEIKVKWREAHPLIVKYWYACEDAATRAVIEGGIHFAGSKGAQVAYRKVGSFLWCRLPSGRCLCFPYPEMRLVTTPWGADKEALTYMAVIDDNTKKKQKFLPDPSASGNWQRVSTYGGDLAQSNTQAVARDILVNGMLNVEEVGYPIVTHVHDQMVVEIASSCEDSTTGVIESLMSKSPAWAKGLPVVAKGWRGFRFRK